MGRSEDGNQNIPVNAPAGGGGPGRFRMPRPLDVSELPPAESPRSSLDQMRFTHTIFETGVAIVAPWTRPLIVGAELYYRKNLEALQEAVERAILYAPAAIEEETGQALKEILGSILDTLILSAAIVGATSALGATIGGVVGFFFGGVGALPGAAAGAEAGFDVGMFLLEWLGLAFLLEHVASKLGEMASLVGPNVKLAWDAGGKPPAQRARQIDSAAHGLARGIAVLFRLILEAIVMFLLAKGAAKLGELTGKLKASKLGKGFGEWVERNWQKLVDDPRFNPKLKPKPKGAPGSGGSGSVEPEAPLKPEKTPAEIEAEQRAKLEEMKKARSERAKAQARDELVKRCENNFTTPEDQKWLDEDPTGRRKLLAADPAKGKFNVPEAKAALQAEAEGSIKPPVQRDIAEDGSETGSDFVDGSGKTWDHISADEDAAVGADNIMDKALPKRPGAAGENVLVDCSDLTPEQQAALQAEVDARPKPPGTGDIVYTPKR